MQRRNIRTTNEGRHIRVHTPKPAEPAKLPAPLPDIYQKKATVAPVEPSGITPKQKTLQQLVEAAAARAQHDFKTQKSINRTWTDRNYGGISTEEYLSQVAKLNGSLVAKLSQAAFGSMPPEIHYSTPEGDVLASGAAGDDTSPMGWGTNANQLPKDVVASMATNIQPLLEKIKIVVDPATCKPVKVAVGVDGKETIIMLSPRDYADFVQATKEEK